MTQRTARSAAQGDQGQRPQWHQNPTIVIEQKPVARFRVRGWGIKEVDDPALIKALLEGGDATNPHVAQALVREGLFVEGPDVPREVKFTAELSFRRPALLPKAVLGYQEDVPSDLCISPRIHWQTSAKAPRALDGRAWSKDVLASRPALWIEDPASSVAFPFWPDADVGGCIRALQAKRLRADELSTVQRAALFGARVLVPRSTAEDWEGHTEQKVRMLAKSLKRDHYLRFEQLVSPLHLANLRRYFRALEHEGYLHRGDSQVERRLALYREPLSQSIHAQLAVLLSRVTGESLRASYSYFGVYLPGAVLQRHKDRPQCRWNLSLIWDTRPERGRADAWPIYLDVAGRTRQVNLGMGDALLYRGTELFHWRDKQPPRSYTTATFFHFVPADFEQSLD